MPGRPFTGATHLYGRVLVATIAVLVGLIALPSGHVGEGIALIAQALLLALVAGTSDDTISRTLTVIAIVAVVVGVVSTLGATLPARITLGTATVLVAATNATLVRGLMRLLREKGVTPQAVAGGITLYILIGVLFADLIGSIAYAQSGDYFAQHTDGTSGERVYFSFVSLTTTGFGDFTPGTEVGRAIAVLEVLMGQIYLVTVVAMLVGNLRRRSDALVRPPR
jgi:Ion channel